MHALWRLIVRMAGLPARFGRWLYLLGRTTRTRSFVGSTQPDTDFPPTRIRLP